MAYNNSYTAYYRNNRFRNTPPDMQQMPRPVCPKESAEDFDNGRFPIAMCYVPWQKWCEVYDMHDGFLIGTIFPCLNKPFIGRGIR